MRLSLAIATIGMTSALACAGTTSTQIYDHRGSEMEVFTGGTVLIHFVKPHPDLRRIGVKKGDKFLEGELSPEGKVTGKATIYPKNCKPVLYDVSGAFSKDAKELVLTGPVPRVNRRCEIVDYDPKSPFARLVFTYKHWIGEKK